MLKSIITSFGDTLKERVKSPLIGAIVCAWLLLNWEIILKLCSVTIQHNDAVSFVKNSSLLRTIFFPVIIGFAYVILYPGIEVIIQKIRNWWFLKSKIDRIKHQTQIAIEREELKKAEASAEKAGQETLFDFEKQRKEFEIENENKKLIYEYDQKKRLLSEEQDILKGQREEINKIERDLLSQKEKISDERNKLQELHKIEREKIQSEINEGRELIKSEKRDLYGSLTEDRERLQHERNEFNTFSKDARKVINEERQILQEERIKFNKDRENFKKEREDINAKIKEVEELVLEKDLEIEALKKSNLDKSLKFIKGANRDSELVNSIRIRNFNEDNYDGVDFSNSKLQSIDFNNKSLISTNFVGANLIRTEFRKSDLTEADFSKAILIGSFFENAILIDAKFNDANLERADFSNANMIDADFTGANLESIILKGTDLTRAKGLTVDQLSRAYNLSFSILDPKYRNELMNRHKDLFEDEDIPF